VTNLDGIKMQKPEIADIKLQRLREIATRKLRHYGKDGQSIRECYLFQDEFLAGIRYESGPISFVWKSSENSALILRGELLIESVSLLPGQEERRAA